MPVAVRFFCWKASWTRNQDFVEGFCGFFVEKSSVLVAEMSDTVVFFVWHLSMFFKGLVQTNDLRNESWLNQKPPEMLSIIFEVQGSNWKSRTSIVRYLVKSFSWGC